MPIELKFLGNVSDLLRGTDNVEKALDKVADSLDDVAKDAQRAGKDAGDNLADGVQDAERDVDRSTERMERSFRDLARDAVRSGDDAGDGIARGVRAGTKRAEEGLDELKSESTSTARESAASFSGEWTDVADTLQEVAANAFAGFGPAGAAAGLLVAGAIGIAVSAVDRGIEGAEVYREKVQELAEEFITTGELGESSFEFLIDNLRELATETEDGKVGLRDLNRIANESDSDFRNLAQAYGNNVEKLRDLWRESEREEKALQASAEAWDANTASADENYGALLRQAEAQGQVTDYLGQQIGIAAEAAEAQRLYALAGGPELEAKAALIGQVNDAYDEAAGDAQAYLNAESGIFDVQAYIDSMAARSQALADYQTALANAALSPEAKSFLNSQGAEAAATFMAGYQAATPGQKEELNRIWSEAGRTNSGEYQRALKGALPDRLDKKVKVEADADTSQAERELNRLANQVRYTTIRARVVDQFGRPVG